MPPVRGGVEARREATRHHEKGLTVPFAITQSCCADATCVSVCPVNCIHPAPGEPGFGTSEILHIDAAACIDCGACADACPVDAIFPTDRLSGADLAYAEINAAYYAAALGDSQASDDVPDSTPDETQIDAPSRHHTPRSAPPSGHVAVIGAGAAGLYTVKELLARTEAQVTVIDALPTPGGLIRSGVASDHPSTKQIQRTFDVALDHRRVSFLGGVALGRDVTLDELTARFDAVFVATGAARARKLEVPGADDPRVLDARTVAAWAGGVPDVDSRLIERLTSSGSGEATRLVVIGTGNVALDLARLFTTPASTLERTDVADRALDHLRRHRVSEVLVLGRGTRANAAYTLAEFRALEASDAWRLRVIDADEPTPADLTAPATEGDDPPSVTILFGTRVERFGDDTGPGDQASGREATAPTRFGGADGANSPADADRRAFGVTIARADDTTFVPASGVITSLGQEVEPVAGLAFDGHRGALTHERGRVRPGVYVVGWAKRGALGGIGANRQCAAETVASYLDDADGLPEPTRDASQLARDLARRGVEVTTRRGARAIDRAERRAGEATNRPRVKFTTLDDLRRAAGTRRRIGSPR